MILLLVVGLWTGYTTGQVVTKRELIKNGAYFCAIDDERIRRCYEITENPLARERMDERTN
jgi:hypothetical protein